MGTLGCEKVEVACLGHQKSTEAKLMIGIFHVNPLKRKPNKVGISPENAYVYVLFWVPTVRGLRALGFSFEGVFCFSFSNQNHGAS